MKKSAVRTYRNAEQEGESADNKSLSQLMLAWDEAETTMERIFELEVSGAVSLKTDVALRDRFERRLKSIEARQVWLIERIADLPAKSMDEVLKKLVLWRSMNLAEPEPGEDIELTPAERLISGAINDLDGFLNGSHQPMAAKA
ncbi:MAG: hypothetical protein ACRBEQ_09815 [Hyphomonas sp.]